MQPFQQNYNQSQQGTTALGNALGLNGASGNQAATTAFWNNPATAATLQTGSQNVLRNQAATGQLNSGATDAALQNLGQQTASQGFNNYVSQLQPYQGAANSAATGIGGLDSGLGSQLNANYMGLGNAQYGAQTSIGNANANADLAGLTASGNIIGAGMNLAGGLAGGLGQFLKLSDARAKDDIEPVGKLYDGQNVYRYRYKGSDRSEIGLIAQEVEKTNPDAVVDFGGVKLVDYGRATNYASDLMKMAA